MNKNKWKDIIGKVRVYSKDFEDRADIVMWDVLEINKEQWIKVEFISKNSPHAQGIRLAIDAGDGFLDSDGENAKSMQFWEHTAPKEFYVKCVSQEGLLSIYNIFQERHFSQSQMYGTGMILTQDEIKTKTIYHCNDYGIENVAFDKIVFSIEKIDSVEKEQEK